jgi:2-keto-4-pentenoate hydratase/2-oxohepta-3-ene-1,7-dioic acid hydratase in catechol pathway
MKLASYLAGGREAYGVVSGNGLITLNERLGFESLDEALASGALGDVEIAIDGARPDHDLNAVELLPVISNPGKILCVGLNYGSHAAEQGGAPAEKPNIFLKFADALVAHDGVMRRPKASVQFDWEGELVVVIGRGGRAIDPKHALDYVAGYTCGCDSSVRDFIKTSLQTGKTFPSSTPIGPWMVTADEIPDPSKLTLETRLNGTMMQRSGTDAMIHAVPSLIAYCSTFTPLAPGDLIFTGTPDGIGAKRTPPVWMKDGDVLEVEISKIGTLRARVLDEA